MARKSRKKINQVPVSARSTAIPARITIPTAAYVRLSSEDEMQDTIQTQTTLLKQFITAREELTLTDVYVDNGFTGTNFNRPEFIRLMADVKQGKIKCIVIKDLSRLGRDFLETGYYIETIFPKLGVRLIAINDQFDSSREADLQNLSVPIKNLVNELYAKDISKKIHAHNDPKIKKGTMTLGRAPYGYQVNDENCFEPDEEVAPVVRMIFAWSLMGKRPKEIAEYINFLGYSIPGNYTGYQISENDSWNGDVVRSILRNDVYSGTLTLGKTRSDLMNKVSREKVSEDERYVFVNRHTPLVVPEDFEFLKGRRNARCTGSGSACIGEDKYKGKIFCGECNRAMVLQRNGKGNTLRGRNSYRYICKKRPNNQACNQSFDAELLDVMIHDQIKALFQLVLDKHKLKKDITSDYLKSSGYYNAVLNIARLEARLEDCKKKNMNLYQDLVEHVIDVDDYRMMKVHFTKELAEVESDLEQEKERLEVYESEANTYKSFVEEIFRHGDGELLTADAIDSLISQIIIYKDRGMEIKFNFEDPYKEILYQKAGG